MDPGSVGSRQVLGQRRAAYPGTMISASASKKRTYYAKSLQFSRLFCFCSRA